MRFIMLMLIALFAAMPMPALAQKANTIDELAKMYDSSSCKTCHAEIYGQWEKSMHSRSLFGTKRTMGGFKGSLEGGLMKAFAKTGVKEVKDIKVEHFAQCFKCHLPQIKDATDAVAQQIATAFISADKATLEKLGITCIVCHNTKAIIHKWQDGEPEAGVIYGSKDGAHPDKKYKTMKKSAIMSEAVLCGQCHGLGPNLEFPQPSQCATAYGSYLHAYIPSGGTETCQDCHMKKDGKGHLMPAYSDADMRKRAVAVDVEATSYKFLMKAGDSIPMSVVTVRITNKAGHRIPDGWPSPQRLVLDVTAKTKDGKEIFKDSKIYMTQATNSRGDAMIYGAQFKMGYTRDTSLQPNQTRVETYEIKFPFEDVEKEKDKPKVREIKAKEMDVTVELRYQLDPAPGEEGKDSFSVFKTTRTVKIQ